MAYISVILGLLLNTLCLHLQICHGLPDVIRIGGLIDKGDIKTEVAFRYAVDYVSNVHTPRLPFRLEPMIDSIPMQDSFYASKRVCHLLHSGVAAIFGPQSPKTSSHVQSICDAMEVPHVEIRSDSTAHRVDYSVNLHPHPTSLGKAYLDLIYLLQWKSFCILYEYNEGLIRLQNLLKQEKPSYKVTVMQLPKGLDYRSALRKILWSGERNVLLDCDISIIGDVLKQAQQIGMMTPENSYIIATLDLHLVELEDFKFGGTNITSVRLTDPNDPKLAHIFQNIQDRMMRFDTSVYIPEGKIILGSETALMYDAVFLFVIAIQALDNSTDISVKPLACDGANSWAHGYSLNNYMKLVNMTGLTGNIQFDSSGLRTDFSLDIVSLTMQGLEKVGAWTRRRGANYTHRSSEEVASITDSIRNKTLIVSFAFNDPYIMLKESTLRKYGNDRYEGFCVDLLNEVAKALEFNFIMEAVPFNSYGSKNENGEWGGMIKELLEKRADIAITDMSVNSERLEAVDFTMPFMNLGITILYKKAMPSPPRLFSFMSPLSVEVWMYMMSAFIGVSLLLYILARLSPYEWQNPHPCNPDPDTLENQFNINNCIWFAIGSIMQQGCDFLPQATSTRMVAGMWWFFTLIMISSYTANLAAFLTIEQLESPIENVQDLAKQTKIKYGSTATGTTRAFFRDSRLPIYQQMYAFMESEQDVFVNGAQEGYDKVMTEEYAFLTESTSIEYITQRVCDLSQVGGLLDSKSYGIALQPGSTYKASLDVAILNLQEKGRLHILKEKWWKEKRGGGKCKEAEEGGSGANPLNLDNVGGVFLVLIIGMTLALAIALCEFFGECTTISKEDEVPLLQVLKEELRFVFKFKGSVKPIRGKKQSEDSEKTSEIYSRNLYNSYSDKMIYT